MILDNPRIYNAKLVRISIRYINKVSMQIIDKLGIKIQKLSLQVI